MWLFLPPLRRVPVAGDPGARKPLGGLDSVKSRIENAAQNYQPIWLIRLKMTVL
jgi:hypothetical protein